MPRLGFDRIEISAYGKVIVKKGDYFDCSGLFQVTGGVFYAFSEDSNIVLTLPESSFKSLKLTSESSSVRCRGLDVENIELSAYGKVELASIKAGLCSAFSESGTIDVDGSSIENGNFSAYEMVDMELSNFRSIGISSEAGQVTFTYLGNEQVNAKCRSESSSVRVFGSFKKYKDAEKTLKISAYKRIDLIGRGQR